MCLSGVSMAIPCTEIIRGDPRLGPGSQRGQIYISSRAVKTPSPCLPLPSYLSLTVCASHPRPTAPPPPPHNHLPSTEKKKKNTFTTATTLCCFLTLPPLPVTHWLFGGALSSCAHSRRPSLLSLKLPSWGVFLSFSLSIFPSSFLFFPSQQEESCLSPPRQPLIHPAQSLAIFPPQKRKKERKKKSLPPQ